MYSDGKKKAPNYHGVRTFDSQCCEGWSVSLVIGTPLAVCS